MLFKDGSNIVNKYNLEAYDAGLATGDVNELVLNNL